MKKLLICVLLAASIVSASLPALAQDNSAEIKCDKDTLQNVINIFIGELGKLKTGSETDPVKIADVLQGLANDANKLRATCDGLGFSGAEAKVIGPVNFPAGIYKATATADDETGINVLVTAVKGECGAGLTYYSTILFSVSKGEATLGSKGCDAIIEVKSYGGNWNLSFERLSSN